MATFSPPQIHDNPDGWGPPMDLAPKRFQDMPYAPFSKSDRLGRAADWTSHANRHNRDVATEDSASEFTMVDNKVIPRPGMHGRGRGRGPFRGRSRFDRNNDRDGARRNTRGNRNNTRGGRTQYKRWDDRRNIQREPSVHVASDWEMLEEIPATSMLKMSNSKVAPGTELAKAGSLPVFDRVMDRITVKNPRPLKIGTRQYPRVTPTDDPIIRRLAGAGEGTVFATSSILALIMMAPRSVQSWDLIVLRIGGKLFFDKRDGSLVDHVTVNETAPDPPKDEKNLQPDELINSLQHLSKEATGINDSFRQATTSATNVLPYGEENPFIDEVEGEIAPVAYRYRKWTLNKDVTVVARCELDGAFNTSRPGAEPITLSIRALNEYFDPMARQVTDWRGKLDTQRGAVLATEVKNNGPKLARWTAEAMLAGADHIKFGFVSRTQMNKNGRHSILGTQMYRPKEFASQIALNTSNMWGVLESFIGVCMRNLKDGEKGVLLKDPNKPIVRLYRVPDDAFDSTDDEDDDDDVHNDGSFL